jgi:hypothetical protein
MKTSIIHLLASALLFAAPSALQAQDDDKHDFKAYVSFGQNFAHGHAHDMTQKTWAGVGAYHAEFGVQFYHTQSTLLVRPNAGYTRILGDPIEGKTIYDVLGVFVGLDLVYNPTKKLPLTITTGPSFHSWSIEDVAVSGNPLQGERSLKFGFRVGLGYDITKDYRVDLTYTMTEWRSNFTVATGSGANRVIHSGHYVPGFNPSLPAYFTLKGTYTF